MTAAQLEKVLQNWQQVKENEWLASCPFPENHNHGDVHPSLVITEKGEKGGEVIVYCRIRCFKTPFCRNLSRRRRQPPRPFLLFPFFPSTVFHPPYFRF